MMVLAHAGHWAVQLLYLLPVVTLIGAVALAKWRDPGDADADADADERSPTDREEAGVPGDPERPTGG